jgi:predicted Fe-S protein YdhL (DUF1289 family)
MRGHYVRIARDRHIGTWHADICIGKGRKVAHLGNWMTYDLARRNGVRFADAIRLAATRYLTQGYR